MVEGEGGWGSNLENSETSMEWMGWRGPDGRWGESGEEGGGKAGEQWRRDGGWGWGGREGMGWGRRKAKEVLGEGRIEVGGMRVDALTEPEAPDRDARRELRQDQWVGGIERPGGGSRVGEVLGSQDKGERLLKSN